MYHKFVKSFFIKSLILLFIIAFAIIIVDPFFHYHAPLGTLKAVMTQREYQCIGTVKHFEYDSLLVGSSVAENYNSKWFDEGFSCKTLKAIRASGSTADLTYYVNQAFQKQPIKNIFYNIDLTALLAGDKESFAAEGCPMYLYNDFYLDDAPYIWNKDVLLESIPFMLAKSYLEDYDEGMAYAWAQWKSFNAPDTLSRYTPPEEIQPMKDAHFYKDALAPNLAMLESMIQKHPDTQFYFFFPPYSLLWWNDTYANGDLEAYCSVYEQLIPALMKYNNVKMYYFQNDRDIVLNLDNYMDWIHFSDQINYQMYQDMIQEQHRLTETNYQDIINDTRNLGIDIGTTIIHNYYELYYE